MAQSWPRSCAPTIYLAALYLPRPGSVPAQLDHPLVPKRMSLKVLAGRISAREFQRYWKERIALNGSVSRLDRDKNPSALP